MPRFRKLDVLNSMLKIGVIPVFYHPDLETVKGIVKACADGGATVVEFTNRGDHAHEVFSELDKWRARELPNLMLGAGSIVDPATATLYIQSGADFIVGPILNAEVAKTCNRRKIPYSPGCGSGSEISYADELGCDIVKVFPGAQVGGPDFIKMMLLPCPWVMLMPTGGVDTTEESLSSWFKAGVVCVGMGTKLIRDEWVKARNFDAIRDKTKEVLATVQKVRGGK